jgi:hypothetical protein
MRAAADLRRGKLRGPVGVLCDESNAPMSHEPTDTETQRRASMIVRSIDVSAPASLHDSIRELAAQAQRPKRVALRWGGLRLPGQLRLLGVGALACLAILAAILALSAGGPASPTVLQASALARRPATQNAPDENPRAPGQLAISAQGIPYPYWDRRFGWRTAGVRTDRLGGRSVTTVFYTSVAGRRIAYSIVGGRALAIPSQGQTMLWRGVAFRVFIDSGRTVVTWRRAGHTCILVGSRVSSNTLLTLANWQAT